MRRDTVAGIGIDGCTHGWFYVRLPRTRPQPSARPLISPGTETSFGVKSRLVDLLDAEPSSTMLIDIPIGLRDVRPPDGPPERLCDLEARGVLAPGRKSSVFPVPSRAAVYANSYEEACERNEVALGKRLSKQSWAIAPKIREVDSLLQARPEIRPRLRETHPEICFWGIAGNPMRHPKKKREGFRERLEVLGRALPEAHDLFRAAPFLEFGGFEASRDDVLDALAAAVAASRITSCRTLPRVPETDSTGLPMEIVYARG